MISLKDLETLRKVYNERLLDAFRVFRQIYRALAARLPELRIHFHYATLGTDVHDTMYGDK